MIRFNNDYNRGALDSILDALAATSQAEVDALVADIAKL